MYPIFNAPGNKYGAYTEAIISKFLDLYQITSPEHYYNIQSLFVSAKKSVLGYYEPQNRTKHHNSEFKHLQINFSQMLNLMLAQKTALSVMRAKLAEKALYLCYTEQRKKRYQTWLKKLENQDYPKRTRLLFSELRAKNRAMENFSSIRNSEGLLAESQAQCLFYWSQ